MLVSRTICGLVVELEENHLLAFWGKAQPRHEHGPSYHPLPYHALDVAAVGKVWLELDTRLTAWFARSLGMPSQYLSGLICPFLALHDIGKFAASFQLKVPDRFPSAVFGGVPSQRGGGFRHDSAGFHFLKEQFARSFPHWEADDIHAVLPLLSAVTGHHGEPPPDRFAGLLLDDYRTEGLEAALAYCRAVFDLMGHSKALPDERLAERMSTAVAGFGIACDWLGSNQEYFPYAAPDLALVNYWPVAQQQARAALAASGLIAAVPASSTSLAGLLNIAEPKPTSLQHWAATTELPDGPMLVLLEDETGSGKTEAALILASRLMAKGDATGIYTALPTMATANALFGRLAACYAQLFAKEATPSLALVHGRSHLLAAFRRLNFGELQEPERYGTEESASTLCSAWLADDRRKALLADVGVGTIDQAVLAILPARFQALRLFGLARKVLILDEVHAYDAFVSQELERLIEWQATLGGSCVLLSATLPVAVRRRLISAFRRATGGPSIDIVETRYPLATLASRDDFRAAAMEDSSERARRLPVRFLRHPDEALETARRLSAEGRAVAYIRNTVDDAIEAYERLRGAGIDALLFHARMALIDRFEVEERILRLFGKDSDARCRSGKVLVATQVIEQSLDLDFDSMITDLSPIDLIVQRAGRLWRHLRPGRPGSPELLVVSPEPVPDADKNWYGRLLPRAQWVYRDHARLWLTADSLQRCGAIETPRDVRRLIESVYGDEVEDRIPEALRASLMEAEGKSSAHRGLANRQVLSPQAGYISTGPWDDDARATTRLQERQQSTLRLAIVRDGRIFPYAAAFANANRLSDAERWTLSELQVSAARAHEEVIPSELVKEVEATKAAWGRFDQSQLLLVLRSAQENMFCGAISDAATKNSEVRYSCEYGLVFSNT